MDVWTYGRGSRIVHPSTRPPIHTVRPRRITRAAWLLLSVSLSLSGCGYYSFTGATIPANLNTVAVPLAEDRSLSPLTSLDERLTELLIDRFVRQTRLSLQTNEDDADAVLTASIDRYQNTPTAVTGEERATSNRVTLTVSVRYFDRTQDQELLRRTFTSFADYNPLEGGLEAEEQAAVSALENIADDIFTAATSNW